MSAGRLICDSGHALYLQAGHPFLAGADRPKSIAPMAERNPRLFKYCSNTDGELLFAVVATPQKPLIPFAGCLVPHLVDSN